MKKSYSFLRGASFIFFAACLSATAHAASAQTYNVGATPTGAPFTFFDIKADKIRGSMIDIADAVSKAGGFSIHVVPTSFSALIPSLTSNKIDFISAGMIKTEERTKVVSFSEPVYSYGEGLMVKSDDNTRYTNLDALKGQVIGVQGGTVYYTMLNKMGTFKAIKTYNTIAEMVTDLKLGRIKAAVADQPIIAYQLKLGTFSGVKLSSDYVPTETGQVCFVVRKGDTATLDTLNNAIHTIKSNGTLEKILNQWGLSTHGA